LDKIERNYEYKWIIYDSEDKEVDDEPYCFILKYECNRKETDKEYNERLSKIEEYKKLFKELEGIK